MESNHTNMLIVAYFNTIVLVAAAGVAFVKWRARRKLAVSRSVEQQHAAYSQGCDEECGI